MSVLNPSTAAPLHARDWAAARAGESAPAQVAANLHPDASSPAADAAVVASLNRIAATDSQWHAFASVQSMAVAQAQARRAVGPMAGLPVAVKDIFDTRDLPTGYGSVLYPPRVALRDAAIVAVLQRLGAVVVGKAATTELAFLHPAPTRNPVSPGRTPGGSSAGSAAAVAAGQVPLAIGTQTGGSVIRPASYCGVVGYKPSFGWLPTDGLKCFSWSLDTVGLFTQDVADAAWCAEQLTGRQLLTVSGSHAQQGSGARRRWRVGVPQAFPWGDASPSAWQAIRQATNALAAADIEVVPLELPGIAADAFEAHGAVQGFEAWRCLAWEREYHLASLSAELVDYLEQAAQVTPEQYRAAHRVADEARASMAAWLQQGSAPVHALLLPSAPDEAPLGLASTGPSTFNRLWTLLGWPCLSVPGLLGLNGAPMGVQLVGPAGHDAAVLAIGERLESAIHAARLQT